MKNYIVTVKVDNKLSTIREWASRRDVAKRHGLIDFENIYPFSKIEFVKVEEEK